MLKRFFVALLLLFAVSSSANAGVMVNGLWFHNGPVYAVGLMGASTNVYPIQSAYFKSFAFGSQSVNSASDLDVFIAWQFWHNGTLHRLYWCPNGGGNTPVLTDGSAAAYAAAIGTGGNGMMSTNAQDADPVWSGRFTAGDWEMTHLRVPSRYSLDELTGYVFVDYDPSVPWHNASIDLGPL